MVKQCPNCKSMNLGKKSSERHEGGYIKVVYVTYCKDCGDVEDFENGDWNI